MKTIKVTEEAWKGLTVLKTQMNLKTLSEAIITVIHTAIVNIYEEEGLKPNRKIRELEKAINWRNPYDKSKK